MKNNDYYQSKFLKESFACPHCGVFAQHKWYDWEGDFQRARSSVETASLRLLQQIGPVRQSTFEAISLYNYKVSECIQNIQQNLLPSKIRLSQCSIESCNEFAMWRNQIMVYPKNSSTIPNAPEDLPEGLKKLYKEAQLIASESPRSSIIIIRIIFEKLFQEIFKNNKELYDNLQEINDGDLNRAAEGVRIIGNKAKHYELKEIFNNDKTEIIANDLQLICKVLDMIVLEYVTKKKKLEEVAKVAIKYKDVAKAEENK